MTSNPPRAVLFDLFHTLVSVTPPGREDPPTVTEVLGVDPVEWRRLYYADDVLERCTGVVRDPVDAMRRTARLIDPGVPEDRIRHAATLRAALFRRGLVDVDPGSLRALKRLRAAGVHIGIVSDAGVDDVEAWHDSPLRELVDAVVFSYEAGIRKPDPRIYQRVLDVLDTPASDAVFVGDGGSNEHDGARAVGMTPVLVTRLMSRFWPEWVEPRSRRVDAVFLDVEAFVESLDLPTG